MNATRHSPYIKNIWYCGRRISGLRAINATASNIAIGGSIWRALGNFTFALILLDFITARRWYSKQGGTTAQHKAAGRKGGKAAAKSKKK
jgi:hypothetical protein